MSDKHWLIDLCKKPEIGLDGEMTVPEHIYLVVPSNSLPKSDRKRLNGRSGPYGKICNVTEWDDSPEWKYKVVAIFNRLEIIGYLNKNL